MTVMLRTLARTGATGAPATAPASAAAWPPSPFTALAPPPAPLTHPCTAFSRGRLLGPCLAFSTTTTTTTISSTTTTTGIASYCSTSASASGSTNLVSNGSSRSSVSSSSVSSSSSWCPAALPGGAAPRRGSRRRPAPAPAPPRSTASNGQVGPPPPRKPHKGSGSKAGDKAAASPGSASSAAAAAVAVAPPASSLSAESAAAAVFADEPPLEELDEEAGQQLAPYMDAVVKVYCMHTEPNYSLPWQRKRQYSSSSSGFVVRYGGRNWLLTNAHSVDYHTQVKVKRRGDDRKFLARVISVGVDCDIAALEVDDPEFWGAEPGADGSGAGSGAAAGGAGPQRGPPPVLELGPLPRLQDGVAVVGYPIGGDTISVTAGVVSRIEVTDYSHGSTDLLAIQIDAAINGGNSGGPVFNRACQCVGIAFQALVGSDVENVGYVIPTPVVTHFLEDYLRTRTFSGFPALGLQWQRMESDALRRAYGMSPGQKGVLVRGLNPTSAAAALLRPDDVLLSFDGTPISNDGTVPFRTGERIAFSHLITSKFVGDSARLEVLRGGQRLELTVTLSKPAALVPPHLSNRDPPYLIVGGLVFTTASEPYLQSEYGSEYGSDAPVKLLDRLYHGFPKSADEEVIVLSQVLACDATLGYEDVYNVQLLRFNGQPVTNLAQLAERVRQALQQAAAAEAEKAGSARSGSGDGAAAAAAGGDGDDFLRFDLDYNEVVVVEARDVLRVTPEVMRAHSIPHDMSPDIRAALAATATSAGSGSGSEPGSAAAGVSGAGAAAAPSDGGRA